MSPPRKKQKKSPSDENKNKAARTIQRIVRGNQARRSIVCPISMENMRNGKVKNWTKTRCGHLFKTHALNRWKAQPRVNCPSCRSHLMTGRTQVHNNSGRISYPNPNTQRLRQIPTTNNRRNIIVRLTFLGIPLNDIINLNRNQLNTLYRRQILIRNILRFSPNARRTELNRLNVPQLQNRARRERLITRIINFRTRMRPNIRINRSSFNGLSFQQINNMYTQNLANTNTIWNTVS